MTGEPIFTLRIERGAPFFAHAWPVLDAQLRPRRETEGIEPRCRIRSWTGAFDHVEVATSVVMIIAPAYGPEPVVGAQIDAMSAARTAALPDLDAYVWALAVNADPVVSGLVAMEWATSR